MPGVARSYIPLLAGFILLFVTAMSGIALSARQQAAVGWAERALRIESRLSRIRSLVSEAEMAQRGYLLTANAAYLTPYDLANHYLPEEIDGLQRATNDRPGAQIKIAQLRPLIRAKLYELAETLALARVGRKSDALVIVRSDRGERYSQQIRSILTGMISAENRLLDAHEAHARQVAEWLFVVRIVSGLLVVLLALAVIWVGKRQLRDLDHANARLREEIEQRNQAQSQLRQLQKMESLGQLTGGIAHDFNNMLAIVIGSLDLARRRLAGSEDGRVGKCIDSAREGAERAAALTAKLLAFSRRQPLEPKVLDANRLIGGMSEMLRRTLGERIEIETVIAGGLWKVCADRPQIETALVNLAVNARDAMPEGGKLTIETANTELDERYARAHEEVMAGQYVMFSVTDTGSGMAPEIIERAFDPFYTTKEVGRGTGLGLSQVFGFVKQSGGHVKVYSEIDLGTTVKIYLPRYTGDDGEDDAAKSPMAVPRGQSDEIILVVEDDDRVRHVSVDALLELGYTVIQARDGTQAIERLAEQPHVDLLFTDIVMPGMTGRELADRATAMRPSLKVLYTTGYTRNAIIHNGIVDHGVVFLAKPFSVAALAGKVRELLDSK